LFYIVIFDEFIMLYINFISPTTGKSKETEINMVAGAGGGCSVLLLPPPPPPPPPSSRLKLLKIDDI
jgi:hypothetical protein